MTLSGTALIVSSDMDFVETMKRHLISWGLMVSLAKEYRELPAVEMDIVLLDIRQQEGEWLPVLSIIRAQMTKAEIILMNRPDNIPASILGMQAGADDEIISPFDTGVLKDKIYAVSQRRKKRKTKKSLLKRFEDVMIAITFAQSGEYDTAIDILKEQKDQPSYRKDQK
jgi:DNA-binding response OmpR family regulator